MTASTLPRARRSRDQLVVGVVLALSLYVLGLQAAVLRPFLWPAGAGLALSAESIFGQFAEVRPLTTIRPPDLRSLAGTHVTVTHVWSGGAAEQHRLHEGLRVDAVSGSDGQTIDLSAGLPTDPAALLRIWRAVYDVDPRSPITMTVRFDKPKGLSPPESPGLFDKPEGLSPQKATVTLPRSSITTVDADGRSIWIRQHLGPLAQLTAFVAGATVLFALGARGVTASLMMLALIATGVANSGPLLGAERAVPLLAPIALIFNWIVTPLAFPVIGIAVLCFPRRAAILDQHRWIVPALGALVLPMFMANFSGALFLLGMDGVLPLLGWLAARPWVFDASFAAALVANLLIVAEGIQRYRANQDPNERRRIQIVVFTGVPAVVAYAVKAGVPLITGLAGQPVTLPWPIEAALQAIVLLPAIGLSYAVAVRHVFSPRTVLRQSLQYALARKTLTVLVLLPILALVISLIQQRDRPLATIISGQPMFYLVGLVLAGLGLRYRERAEAWVDLHFFREEYDAREILVSLAGRVPYETDPRDLVALVIQQIDSALHPDCVAVLAGEGSTDSMASPAAGSDPGMLEPVAASRVTPIPLRFDTALVTLLRWSDKPLEVFLDDEESPVARLPQADRVWLTATKAQLLVPIFAGGSDPRPFVGLIVLGRKRSEEPYTTEDRQLLSGIATQMGVALDLSRLRKRAAESGLAVNVIGSEATTQAAGGAHGIAIGSVVDNKYRVEEIVGQGGMGAVFRAWDVRLERSVAIKVVRAELLSAPESRVRFRRESMMVARLQHPAIVTVFDYGSLRDGSAFLVMEYVPGEDLRRLMKREGPLELVRVTSLLSGIAGGVEAAHKAGIFHRDLKPENILLPESGIGPKVVDFGVAKMTDSTVAGTTTLTAGGTVVGTPAYMAPEQLRGSAVDGRADVFSLGVMTYEMLTGRLPFGSGSFIDIAMKQSESQASLDTTGLSSPVAGVLRCAMAIDREARPQSPMVLADELARAAAMPA
jgi:GAF domain-containing protein